MSVDHQRFHFSVTCQTKDAAVLHCLRALCQYAEQGRKPQIGWGGTGQAEWEANDGEFTLRFTSLEFRNVFVDEGQRLLAGKWQVVRTNDKDPAVPQR